MNTPRVSCLCPTFRRPRLLQNALACFLAQDYKDAELVILDDGGTFASQAGERWRLIATEERYESLPDKFNALASFALGSHLVVLEDDDVVLPWHLTAHVQALHEASFSKPSRVLSTYTGTVQEEKADGRFHASIAFTRERLMQVGGWPATKRGDFDQQFLARMRESGPTADPCLHWAPSYVFRWGSTNSYHGQAFMRSPGDEHWYDAIPSHVKAHDGQKLTLTPQFDEETAEIYSQFSSTYHVTMHGGALAA